MIQRRVDASVNFTRNWADYKLGFGNPSGNFWIGLDKLHCLAGPGKGAILNIIMKHWARQDKLFYATYTLFEIGNEADGYRLNIDGYSGDAGNSLKTHNGMKFSTYDRDYDLNENSSCASTWKGGWWYESCFRSALNNLYPDQGQNGQKYMSWKTITGYYGKIIESEMKIQIIK